MTTPVSAWPRLGQVAPRERDGERTADRFEYECERTARAAVDLLKDDADGTCVYCDWHDDYVLEVGEPPTRYKFHQVKGRSLAYGPWTSLLFWGVVRPPASKKAKIKPVRPDGIFPKLLAHVQGFSNGCIGLAFVTNSDLAPELTGFIKAVHDASSESDLSPEHRKLLDHLALAYGSTSPPLLATATELFNSIKLLVVRTNQGLLSDRDAGLRELADLCVEYSEIEVVTREAKQIARELVGVVRNKVRYTSTVVPTDDATLRSQKGVVVGDVLSVLTLSPQGYEALKSGTNRDVVKQLSRLQRFCESHGFDDDLKAICAFRTRWVRWINVERHFMETVDFVALVGKARELLASRPTLPDMGREAKDIAKQFSHITVGTALTAEDVLGLAFSLVAEADIKP